jgi:hypothetical protein
LELESKEEGRWRKIGREEDWKRGRLEERKIGREEDWLKIEGRLE